MAFNFAEAKLLMRRAVHDALGVSALYYAPTVMPVAQDIKVRWHSKSQMAGDLDNGDYAQVETSDDFLVFSESDPATVNLTRGGRIVIPAYQSIEFLLHELVPPDGPFEVKWRVSRK